MRTDHTISDVNFNIKGARSGRLRSRTGVPLISIAVSMVKVTISELKLESGGNCAESGRECGFGGGKIIIREVLCCAVLISPLSSHFNQRRSTSDSRPSGCSPQQSRERHDLSSIPVMITSFSGGGVYVEGSDTSVFLRDVEFTENIASSGSALFIDQSTVTMSSGSIRFNGENENLAEAIFCNGCTLDFPEPDRVLISSNRSCDHSCC